MNDNSNKKFSVLISVYANDSPEFFKEAMLSILVHQSVKPNEVVLVVDGPINDELNNIVIKFEKENEDVLKVIRLTKNVKLGKALEIGMTYCTNELVARADSDDLNTYFRFEQQLQMMNSPERYDLIGSDINEFVNKSDQSQYLKSMPTMHDEIVQLAKHKNPINHVTVMYRKSSVLLAGGYRHIPYLEDYDLWVRMILNGCKFHNINKPLVNVRIGEGMVKRRGKREYVPGFIKINNLMIKNGFITVFEYFRNIVGVCFFVLSPVFIRKILYRKFLRINVNNVKSK